MGKKTKSLGRPCKYPWASLRVGQSFLVKDPPRAGLAVQARYASRVYGGLFVVERAGVGLRVRRVLPGVAEVFPVE